MRCASTWSRRASRPIASRPSATARSGPRWSAPTRAPGRAIASASLPCSRDFSDQTATPVAKRPAFSFVGVTFLPENGPLHDETMPAMKTFYSSLLALSLFALPSAAAAQRGDAVYMEDRLNQLQQTITMLTGQVEQLQYRNQQLQQQMEKMQADHEFRLEQIEKGRGGAARPPGPTPSPGPAPPPNTAANAPPGPGGAGGAQGEQVYHDAFK